MKNLVRPELPTAPCVRRQATHDAVDNSAPLATRPQSIYKSGNAVQTSRATSLQHHLLLKSGGDIGAALQLRPLSNLYK